MVSASASHREDPKICPQHVYKRHCAVKLILKLTGPPEYIGTDMLVRSVESKVPPVHRRERDATVMNCFLY